MQIWLADITFETNIKLNRTIKDVVVTRLPNSHIHRKSDVLFRATRSLSVTELKTFVKDKSGRYKATINYTKHIGQSQQNALE